MRGFDFLMHGQRDRQKQNKNALHRRHLLDLRLVCGCHEAHSKSCSSEAHALDLGRPACGGRGRASREPAPVAAPWTRSGSSSACAPPHPSVRKSWRRGEPALASHARARGERSSFSAHGTDWTGFGTQREGTTGATDPSTPVPALHKAAAIRDVQRRLHLVEALLGRRGLARQKPNGCRQMHTLARVHKHQTPSRAAGAPSSTQQSLA